MERDKSITFAHALMRKERKKMDSKRDKTSRRKFTTIDVVITIIACMCFIGLMTSCFLYFNWGNRHWLMIIGWIILFLSPVSGMMARLAFKKRGGIAEGDSCLNTQKIVDNGIFGIIRNPMYFSVMMFTAGLICISQHWLSVVSAMPIITYFYYYLRIEENLNITKFGDDYHDYMKRVPRLNIIAGLIRSIKT
jgi:protein-S-isoprenylcysteine O-methyltransferase Ste14